MTDHAYHGGTKLTEECSPCMGRGQLKGSTPQSILKDYNFDASISFTFDIIIVMCEACDGHGIIINYQAWMNFKVNNSPDVVFLAEQFLNEHLKPEYVS